MISRFSFNPLQSAKPIFEPPKTAVTNVLDQLLVKQGGKELSVPIQWGFPGSVLTGLGFPSQDIATFRPVLDYWRPRFPEMTEPELNYIFNRTAHVMLDISVARPTLKSSGLIAVPLARVVDNFQLEDWSGGVFSALRRAVIPNDDVSGRVARLGGYIDSYKKTSGGLVISGWGPWLGFREGQALLMYSPRLLSTGNSRPILRTTFRNDVATALGNHDYSFTGFELDLRDVEPVKLFQTLCLVAKDGPQRYFVLQGIFAGARNEENCRKAGWVLRGN